MMRPASPPHSAGVEAVVHLAARVHVMAETEADPLAEFRRVNVDGTRADGGGCTGRRGSASRVPEHLKVNGETREGPYTEADVPRPADTYASRSSRPRVSCALPSAAWRGRSSGRRWCMAPAWVAISAACYGSPASRRRWPLPLGGMDNLRSMIFLDNLADAITASVAHPAARGRTFLVSDDHDVSVSELLGGSPSHSAAGRDFFARPVGLLRQAGLLLGRDADLDRLFGTLRINCSLIRSTLGWRPRPPLDEGLRLTAKVVAGRGAGMSLVRFMPIMTFVAALVASVARSGWCDSMRCGAMCSTIRVSAARIRRRPRAAVERDSWRRCYC